MFINTRELYILVTTEASKRIIEDVLDAVQGIDYLIDNAEFDIEPRMNDVDKLRKTAVSLIDSLSLFLDSCFNVSNQSLESKAEMQEHINELRMTFIK